MIDVFNLPTEDRREILDKFYKTDIGQLFIDYKESFIDIIFLYERYDGYDKIQDTPKAYKKLVELNKNNENIEQKLINKLIFVILANELDV